MGNKAPEVKSPDRQPISRNLAAEKMKAIQDQQDKFKNLGKSPRRDVEVGCSLAAEKMAAIKAQQEAFSKKGQKTEGLEPPVGRGNLAAERMAAIKAQQEAFSKKGQKTEEVAPPV